MKKGIGDRFQKETKYLRGKLSGGPLLWFSRPETYKNYPSAPKIKLGPPEKKGGLPLWEVIRLRHSVRSFRDRALPQSQLSQLLWATQGITRKEMGHEFRTVPSAGALFPVETYLVIHNVSDMEPGIYHYSVQDHAIEQLKTGDFRVSAAEAALDQDMAYAANVAFVWTAVFERSKWKYRQRAYRYVYLDAGHIAQNLALAAVSLGLGTCQIGALYDEEANALLGIDGEEESVLYISVVGHPL
ncbi:MAG: SagB/ThcOx family dehydrogenase [Candidatus Aminicenantes bacterium]|jgi:SagB-type dehydrogenase family enzyme